MEYVFLRSIVLLFSPKYFKRIAILRQNIQYFQYRSVLVNLLKTCISKKAVQDMPWIVRWSSNEQYKLILPKVL